VLGLHFSAFLVGVHEPSIPTMGSSLYESVALWVDSAAPLDAFSRPGGLVMAKFRYASLSLVLGVTLAACGGSQPEAEAPPPAPSAAPAPVEAPPAPSAAPTETAPAPSASAEPPAAKKPAWKDMTEDQKKEVMKTIVYPTMKTEFQEFDSKRFAEMTCMTCHGPGAKEGKFKMPNPKLPKLDPKDGFAKHKKKADILKFMMEKVAPDMAKLLEVEPYDPKTQQGFGCFNCHTMAGK
jgi:hypothetical protein